MRHALATLLVAISWLHPTRADEPRTLYGKTVSEWITVVRDRTSTRAEHERAVWALGCFGPEARDAVPDLVDELHRGPFNDTALKALVRIGAATEATVPYLIERLLKEGCPHLTEVGSIGVNNEVRNNLAGIGGPAVPALLEVLKGPNRNARVCAAEALGEIGPAANAAVPALLRTIEHPDTGRQAQSLRRQAVQALGRIGPDANVAVPALNHLLDQTGGDDFDRTIPLVTTALNQIGAPPVTKLLDRLRRDGDPSASDQLTWLGPRAREAAPALRAALTDRRPQVRISAAVALAHVEPSSAPEAIPVLIEALNHRDDEALFVVDVPRALAQLGPKALTALPPLIAALQNGEDSDDSEILKALVQIDPEGKQCVPALIAALKHKYPEVVHVAANCLSLLGPRASDAVQALTTALTRDFEGFSNGYDPQVSAAHALRRIGPRALPAIPALIVALKYRHVTHRDGFGDEIEDRDSLAAAAAAEVLGSFGANAKAAVPALIEAAQAREKDDANWSVRKAAILALGQIGPDATSAIPTLRNLLDEDGRPSQYQPELMVALAQLAPDGKTLAQYWLAKPWSGRQQDRAMVLGALGQTSVDADWLTRDTLQQLHSMIVDSDPRDRNVEVFDGWFEQLGRFGRAARLAIPRLNDYRKHPDPWIRLWAQEALERITSPPPQYRPALDPKTPPPSGG